MIPRVTQAANYSEFSIAMNQRRAPAECAQVDLQAGAPYGWQIDDRLKALSAVR